MTPEQESAIAELRALNLAPKQIARKLGLRPAEVKAIIKQLATQAAQARTAAGELDPVVECLINEEAWALFKLQTLAPGDREDLATEADIEADIFDEALGGLTIVTVTRQAGYNRLIACTYLVDPWCLGIKNVMGPRQVNQADYKQFVARTYSMFPSMVTRTITLEQAQAVVFSSLEYAEQLGFDPHPDFEQARAHLGKWDGKLRIECGKDGEPFYIDGPYDDPQAVLATLTKSVGEGNFTYIASMG